MNPLFSNALDQVIDAHGPSCVEGLRSARMVMTGCTGFFGGWVLRAILRLNARGYRIQTVCISRTPERFRQANSDIGSSESFSWIKAEAAEFSQLKMPSGITHILHMAASSNARENHAAPLDASKTILVGTLACVEWARSTRAHLHFVSSGAVYGARMQSQGPVGEREIGRGAPDCLDPLQAYGNAKRMAESFVACGTENYSISRPFAFLGPLLPLDQHFAAGNFIADAVARRPIRIMGDGTPLRSYLHPADLAIWLLTLASGRVLRQAINVGSGTAVSIAALAAEISRHAGCPAPIIAQTPKPRVPVSAYWPDVSKAGELGLIQSLSLQRCIDDSVVWARSIPRVNQ